MPHQERVRIVEVERVAGGSVDQRRGRRRGALVPSDEAGRRSVLRSDENIDENVDERLTRPRQRDAEEVENAVARDLTRLGREVLIAKTVDRFDQGPGDPPFVAHVP